MSHLFKRPVPLPAFAAGLSLFLAACSKPAVQEEPIRAVKVFTVGISDSDASSEFAGEVRARVESRLGFRVAGKMVKRQVELGQRVKAGQVLAQLDAQDYKLAADAARAQLAAAATNRDLAAADFKRYKDLKDQNYISGAELERRETALKAARDVDQIEAVAAPLQELGRPVDLPRVFGWVSEWKVRGPFDTTARAGFRRSVPPAKGGDPAADDRSQKSAG